MNDCENSFYKEKIESLQKDILTLKEELAELKTDRRVNEIQFKTILEVITEIKLDLKEMKETPNKRWELIISAIISTTIAFLISFLLK